jgi:hypothetical protein
VEHIFHGEQENPPVAESPLVTEDAPAAPVEPVQQPTLPVAETAPEAPAATPGAAFAAFGPGVAEVAAVAATEKAVAADNPDQTEPVAALEDQGAGKTAAPRRAPAKKSSPKKQ